MDQRNVDQRNNIDERPFDEDDLSNAVDQSVEVRRQQVEKWLHEARDGSPTAAGYLLEACRAYLLKVATQDLDGKLAGKIGASDLVQETLLEAHGGLTAFRGETERELLAWLRTILRHNLSDANRRFVHTDKRRSDREASFLSASRLGLAAGEQSPSAVAGLHEDTERLRAAMECLPEEYRVTIELRNWQLQSFAEIGQQLGRSEEAVRKLWVRALDKLRSELERA